MARLKNGFFGEVSGKVGNVIASSCFGVNYIKTTPSVYRDARSESQKVVRKKFSKIGSLAISLLPTIIRPIWNNRIENISGYNLFMKMNYRNVDNELSLAECDKLIISFGDLPLPGNISVKKNEARPSCITVSWTNNSGSFLAESNDRLRLVAICGDLAVDIKSLDRARSDESAEIALPFKEGQTVRVFVFFQNIERGLYSDDRNFIVGL
jgi:hypothetical protein